MEQPNTEKTTLLESILDHMKVAVTCADADGKILYANAAARKRPSKTPRAVGADIRDCHKNESNEKIKMIFTDFKNGRSEPHHYISTGGGKREMVTIIPMFDQGEFSGCVSHIYPLKFEGPERSF